MKIEKGIPIPVSPTAVLNEMEVGDSIFDELGTIEGSKIYMAARQMRRRCGKAFKAATVEGGIRIWRIE